MKNPEIIRGKTPNGGDYAEMWYLTKSNTPAASMHDAVKCEILEYTDGGELVKSTIGTIDKNGG